MRYLKHAHDVIWKSIGTTNILTNTDTLSHIGILWLGFRSIYIYIYVRISDEKSCKIRSYKFAEHKKTRGI